MLPIKINQSNLRLRYNSVCITNETDKAAH